MPNVIPFRVRRDRTCARVYVGVCVAAVLTGAACGDGETALQRVDSPSRVTRLALVAPPPLEPLETALVGVEAYDDRGTRLQLDGFITWASSDTAVAVVDHGRVRARAPGPATISATVGAITSRVSIDVAWRPDATLRMYPELTTIEPGVTAQLTAFVRSSAAPPAAVAWSTSDPQVASVSATGFVTAVSAGSVTITAVLAGLSGASTVRVAIDPLRSGFGYAYSGTAPALDDYDWEITWEPPETHAYSTSGFVPALLLGPPYPARPDFGWLNPGEVRSMLLLHAVSLEGLHCRALVDVWFNAGAMTWCTEGRRTGNRFETIAATPDAFTGTFALIRPEARGPTSDGSSIDERTNADGSREYYASGLRRGNSYTFVTAATRYEGECVVAPTQDAEGTVNVLCANADGTPSSLPFYAIVFGNDARRGTEARTFAELDSLGTVMRLSEDRIRLTSTARGRNIVTITLTGDAVAGHTRVPAVLLTAVSRSANTTCWMTEPSGAGTPQVTFDVTCDASASGVLIGATY
jgi:hypothetical protein